MQFVANVQKIKHHMHVLLKRVQNIKNDKGCNNFYLIDVWFYIKFESMHENYHRN